MYGLHFILNSGTIVYCSSFPVEYVRVQAWASFCCLCSGRKLRHVSMGQDNVVDVCHIFAGAATLASALGESGLRCANFDRCTMSAYWA